MASSSSGPLVLIVPGLHDSGPGHWQTIWQHRGAAPGTDCERVELGMWDDPHRNTWVNQLNLAIHRAEDAGRKVILAAHSLGVLAAAWWAECERPGPEGPVVGALLVAPPDVERPGADPRVARFSACPRQELPFPAFLVASRNDPWCSHRTAYGLARDWGCRFADAGEVGHINADSGLGDWPFGKALLGQLLRESPLRVHARNDNPRPAQERTTRRPGRRIELPTAAPLQA